MGVIPQISHQRVIRALEKAGFAIIRQEKHISMTKGEIIITIPRANPVNTYTLRGIIEDAGLRIEQFKELL